MHDLLHSEERERNMTIEALIIWLVIGAVAGWLAGLVVKGYGFGLVGNIAVGVVGGCYRRLANASHRLCHRGRRPRCHC